ncbi:methionine sulfoxide reductase A isoform X4 [Nomia melanderi]|uniref:methionine sulfoxide reductase A isoform X4 n=1 Tax=Nomia melanderi TaxID=2448451 RepID=UPI0013040FB5|nr:peptide methionine sulfoxide reductase isoform X4 [Nomia melanderi]XP_031837533.1 peptide methionine sulfoxide reductase isoform X4 [Nomia melanderi]XP_031837534.1 peptide methionine sulfoxide reductase isoform X4 [Nomia melanderi]XP_031837535.1 peptide methionine sulfoxide reductase isoform X4 [Nomia melanderi]XP_031837536.1 peptide methionine sulfoxide reductase isoform X4 [Nomia melanderi]XP_031837537.1 peptide methionine sulfoxide reductase isoform X4 [Nomia melanderi]XP_031837538.1 pe
MGQHSAKFPSKVSSINAMQISSNKMPGQLEEIQTKRATFGMGCFWAGDCLFGVLPGVIRTCVGYAGGQKEFPTYRNLGDHTEVVDIEYNPDVISYSQLLSLFWENHEYGLTKKIKRQYMSLILYHDDEQKLLAEKSREQEQRKRTDLILTEVRKFEKFYSAEDYHQKYRLRNHPWLIETTGLTSDETLKTSPLAAKLNGYLAGAGTIEQFEKELPKLGLSEKASRYLQKYVIENQGNGLYC